MKFIPIAAIALGLTLPAIPASAEFYPMTTRSVADRDLACFMHVPQSSLSMNLSTLCGASSAPINVSANAQDTRYRSGGSVSGSSGSTARSGRCTYSSDRKSNGARCGGNASVRRRGGK